MRLKETLKETLLNIVFMLFVFLCCFLVIEIGFRFYGFSNNIDYTLYLKEIENSDRLPNGLFTRLGSQKVLNPDFKGVATTLDFGVIYSINSDGLRDKEYHYQKPKNITRFLAFGDSFTFGEGVPYGKRFTDIPEKRLSNVEIINFGVPGYGLENEFFLYLIKGMKYSTDYVVIFLNKVDLERATNLKYSASNETYVLKDEWGYVSFLKYIEDKRENVTYQNVSDRQDSLITDGRRSLLKYSYFLSYLRYNLIAYSKKDYLKEYDNDLWGSIFGVANVPKAYEEWKDEGKRTNYTNKGIISNILWRLELWNDILRNEKQELIIINIDSHTQFPFISDFCNDTNCHYLDLAPSLYNLSKEQNLHFTYDPHYNPKTHEYIGNAVSQYLEEIVSGDR